MNFIKETSVICTSFLWANLTKDNQNQLLDYLRTCPDTDLTSIPNGQEIVNILSNLTKTFKQRYSKCYDNKSETALLFKGSDGCAVDVIEIYKSVLYQLFDKTNWGRIIAMFALLQDVTVWLLSQERSKIVLELIQCTSEICNSSPLKSWFQTHNGWNGLLDLHDQTIVDQNVHKFPWFSQQFSVATGTIGAVGLVALLGFIARKL